MPSVGQSIEMNSVKRRAKMKTDGADEEDEEI
jgi:hypothetical protein